VSRPDYFQPCFFGLEDDARLEELIDSLQPLMLRGLFRAGVRVRNDFHFLVSL
jgi:hypothetical protein